jgi:hypothetical protein
MANQKVAELATATLERLCKWRTVLAGWQLGTRAKGDPEGDAVRDQRELLLLLRTEVTALTAILLEKKVCTEDEINAAVIREAEFQMHALEKRFPGFKAESWGMRMDTAEAAQTMKGWKP